MRRVIRALDALLRDPGQDEIRRIFTLWIKRLLRRKADSPTMGDIERINDLLEDDGMLAERIESWFEEATRKGIQQGRMEGRAEGQAEGRAEGQAEGRAALLAKQLKFRFGPLPPDAADRLAHATQDELDAWGEAILSAPSLEAVFETRH
jgi:hypothetical protein